MKLGELRAVMYGNVVLCEEGKKQAASTYPNYIDVFEGDCRHIPQELYERDIVVISAVARLGEEWLEIILENG